MVEQPDRYNTFFNPNVCHVCKMPDNGQLKVCNKCYMISYCSNDHRLNNQRHHKQICTAMQELLKSHSQLWVTVQLNLEQWIQSRKELIRLTMTELSRDLEPYEVEMIMFTKSCVICHQQVNILPCKICWSVNYCLDHEEAFEKYHSSDCKELALCFNTNLRMQYSSSIPVLKFSMFPQKNKPIVDMETFVKLYVRRRQSVEGYYVWTIVEYFYSDYASAPLTLYYGMMNEKLLNLHGRCYVIHIIAANHIDREYLQAWELLLHLLHHVKFLKVVLIGSELQDEHDKIKVCSSCKSQYGQMFFFECHRKLYHDYVDSDSFAPPDVIVICQADLTEWKTLKPIFKLKDQNCPLLLTAKSRHKSVQNISKMEEVLGSIVHLAYHDENKFSSYKPYRDFENDGVSYRNKYLAICPKL